MNMKVGKLLTLTALATGITLGSFVDSAKAFPFGSKRFPQAFGIEFDLEDSSNGQGAIGDFEIIADIAGNGLEIAVADSSTNFELNVEPIDELPTGVSFNDIFIGDNSEDIDLIPKGQIYQFSFEVDDLMLTEKGESLGVENQKLLLNSKNGTVNFFVPSEFTFEGQSFNLFANGDSSSLPDENNLAAILTVPAGSGIDRIAFPSIFTDGFLEGDLSSETDTAIVFDTQSASISESVPEADTLVSILILGGLSGIVGWKRRFK